jgi:polyisoprenoid-binding protein YceI
MKKTIFSALFVAVLGLSAFTGADNTVDNGKPKTAVSNDKAAAKKGTAYKVNTAASDMTWVGKKVTGQHNGNIKLANGQVFVAGSKLTGGNFEIDMNSITCTDLTDAEYNGKLIGHLKSDDFFSTAKYPKAKFNITSLTPIKGATAGNPNYNVKGNLTIKGITNPIEFPATVLVDKKGTVSAKGNMVVDRTKYDIKYGSASIFDSLGDKAIYDDMEIGFNVVAKK